MNSDQPPLRIDVPFLLHAAELLPGDPQVDDYGPLFGAIARMYARAMDQDIYGSLHLKAGALLVTLVRIPCLEHSNDRFAWHAAEAFLALNGYRLEYVPKDAVVLVRDAAAGTAGVAQVARQLHDWSVK
ncbi:fic family toxin-antitoxin system, toxin component [Streptomyces sp. NPDC052396]|uniref:fic family toxin-antitoxin system, toxin component n=1 Tax=Streptomyces sp. NPDC052396 TaxID=3365689 RepID=UPI0037D0859D